MKKQLLYTVLAFLAAHLTTSQVLFSEDFDNLGVGNIGTDHTGNTPGQGGWYTLSQATQILTDANSGYFNIVTEPGRGKVMELAAMPSWGSNCLQKRGIDTLWNTRIPGNDVLKIEYDFFTGPVLDSSVYALYWAVNNDNNTSTHPANNSYITGAAYQPNAGWLAPVNPAPTVPGFYYISTQQLPILKNTWVKLVMYIDYPNQKIYFNLPSFGVLMAYDAPGVISLANSLVFRAGSIGHSPSILSFYKFDNFVISAVNTVPLSVQKWVSSKFNVFPNPANDVVTITNNENIGIEEILVYDINGKTVKGQKSKRAKEIQLNVSSLSSGTYLLHIKTKEGVAIKKLVKN